MFRNYFKTAWRNLRKNKIFSFINIFGLTIGLTSFLLIALYVFDELTYDSFNKNADNIYRVIADKTTGDKEAKIASVGYQVSEKAKADFPEIQKAVRLTVFGRMNISATENNNVFYEDFNVGNNDFLTTFDYPLMQGNRQSALSEPYSVILTEDIAKKLFGTADVLGKAIKIDRDSMPYKITGVLKKFPVNSQLSFNLLVSEASINAESFKKFISSDWESNYFTSYLLLNKNADPHVVETKINQLVNANRSGEDKSKISFILQPLKDVHFYSDDIEGGLSSKGNLTYIYIFAVIALFVLFIACINYMNLTTARFANRAREIAVRKVTGASRQNLVRQFLSEAFLTAFIATILALILTKVLLQPFNTFTGKQLTLGTTTDYRVWAGIGLIVIVISLLSGIYPALFQSGLKPLLLLKNKIHTGKSNISLRRSLVVFQFALSIIMIVATMVVYLQMQYVNTKDMGFKKNQLMVIDINSGKVRRSAGVIKSGFEKLPGVQSVTVSSRVPGEWKNLPQVKVQKNTAASSQGNDMYFLGIDEQFLKTYQITLAKGQNFLPGNPADSSSVLINETAAKELGITQPAGQFIQIPSANFDGDFSPLDKPFVAKVIGIVKDFNFQSLHEPLAPMVLAFENNPIHNIDYFTVRVSGGDVSETLKKMDAILHGIDQNHLLEYHFLDKQWDLFYHDDHVRETIFLFMTILAIIIACLGLFGLAAYAAEQRIKEIGIRKVLGASVQSIVAMLSREFLKLVLIAAAIAFPVAWLAMNKWLQGFAYKINISWWIFIASAIIAILIALITISFQAIKAAIANPVKSLRTE